MSGTAGSVSRSSARRASSLATAGAAHAICKLTIENKCARQLASFVIDQSQTDFLNNRGQTVVKLVYSSFFLVG
jgi:hypothetical protein